MRHQMPSLAGLIQLGSLRRFLFLVLRVTVWDGNPVRKGALTETVARQISSGIWSVPEYLFLLALVQATAHCRVL